MLRTCIDVLPSRYFTTSIWNREQLEGLGVDAAIVPPGIDLDVFRRLDRVRSPDALLAIGRSHALKNLALTIEAWQSLGDRPMWLFGSEPELGPRYGTRYVERPDDERVNELLNEAAIFVQSSSHEGFCLPILEAMAAGLPVVCTDAHGNRDACRDHANCLLVPATAAALAAGIKAISDDPALRERLVAGGLQTAAQYGWERCTDQLEQALEQIASGARSNGGAATGS